MKIRYQKIRKEKGRAPRLCCEARPDVVPRTSLRRIRLKPELLLADAKKHRLCRVDAEKSVADGAADLRMLKLEMALVVLLQDTEYLVHLPLVSRVEQNVGHVVRQVRATIVEDGEGTIPGRTELRLQDVAELLFTDLGHKVSFQGSGLSSHHDSISMYSNHNNGPVSNAKPKTETQESFCSKSVLKNFSFLLLTESGISFCPENSVRFSRRAARSAPRGIDFSYVVLGVGLEPTRDFALKGF